MIEHDIDVKFITEMPCKGVSSVYTTMLATGAAKTYHQATETTFYIIFHGNIRQCKHGVQEIRHFGLLLKEILNIFITAGLAFKYLLSARIQDPPAVEN